MAVGLFVTLGPLLVEQVGDAIGVGRQDEELPETQPAVGPPPLEAGRTVATVDSAASVGAVEQLTGGTVTVGPGGVETLLLGFEPVATDPACLVGVALEVYLHEGVETSVHALPARIEDLGELEQGQSLPANYLLDRTNPATAYTTGASGWLRFQVRGPYQLAARAADGDALVVLAVRLPDDVESGDGVVLSTVQDRPARLRWAGVEGCEFDPAIDDQPEPLPAEDGDAEGG